MDEHWKTCGICGNWTLPEHEVSPGVWLCEVCHGGVVPLPRRPLVERERIGLVDDLETLLVIYILESMLEAA